MMRLASLSNLRSRGGRVRFAPPPGAGSRIPGWEMRMRVLRALSTSVGTKLLLALTGLALVGFLLGHLAGNLLLFLGPEKFNSYGHALISNPLIIPVEIGLVAIFLLHAGKATLNFFDNRAARPQGYELRKNAGGPSRKSWAS